MKTLKEMKFPAKKIELLNKLGIVDSESLLTYYPFRYEVKEYKPYQQWKSGDTVIFEGNLISYPNTTRLHGKMSVSRFSIENDDDIFDITIYNRPWIKSLKIGTKMTIIGKYVDGNKIIANNYNLTPLQAQLGIKPIYSAKEGITQRTITSAINHALNGEIEDVVPLEYQHKYRLLSRKQAFKFIHQPTSFKEVELALRTLKYEEFLKFFLTILCLQDESFKGLEKKPKEFDIDQVFSLQENLPFLLTVDQMFVIKEILNDLASQHVMYRLVQGDVGCGKTIVCAFAMYAAMLAGYQCALLAPTEVLVKQHYESLAETYRHLPFRVAMLYSAMPSKQKQEVIEEIKKGNIQCVVGTHSLIQDEVRFNKLGLVVVDEQQRFGVEQRKKIKAKGEKVDFLLMSATPIPRTLANTLYGDMAVSTIESLPPNRKGVDTYLIKENSIRSIMQDIKNTINKGQQVYIICPSIEQNDNFQARNVVDIYHNLKEEFIGFCSIGMMHGKMSSDEKTKIISDFQKGIYDILVSTTVVEVGVNVVNATMMIIYDAHRFGLSQLHQLRGRVQRGSYRGKCYLLTSNQDKQTLNRLQILVNSTDGFEISKKDLLLRGPGDILGTRQSGASNFIVGNIFTDQNIIEQAQKDARVIAVDQRYRLLINKIIEENMNNVRYID